MMISANDGHAAEAQRLIRRFGEVARTIVAEAADEYLRHGDMRGRDERLLLLTEIERLLQSQSVDSI